MAPKKRGRPPLKPTRSQRSDVCLMKADGWSDERIARALGIGRPALTKHYAYELEHGRDIIWREQLANLKRASKRGSVAAARALMQMINTGPPKPAPTFEEATEPRLGKKEQAQQVAQTAEAGTTWDTLVKH